MVRALRRGPHSVSPDDDAARGRSERATAGAGQRKAHPFTRPSFKHAVGMRSSSTSADGGAPGGGAPPRSRNGATARRPAGDRAERGAAETPPPPPSAARGGANAADAEKGGAAATRGATPEREGTAGEEVRATEEMCLFAFEVLHAQLCGRAAPRAPPSVPDIHGCGLFVTWKKLQRSGRYQLRGCIGSLTPVSLREGLQTYAISAALKDRRFSPIVAAELQQLQVCVSLLYSFERISVYDWTIGVHGLIVEFRRNGRSYSATYLPEICAEQGWSKVECLQSLARKAGVDAQVSEAFMESSLKLTRYKSSKFVLPCAEYLQRCAPTSLSPPLSSSSPSSAGTEATGVR